MKEITITIVVSSLEAAEKIAKNTVKQCPDLKLLSIVPEGMDPVNWAPIKPAPKSAGYITPGLPPKGAA